MSRDRLLGILWPDTDEERSRHALSQTLYSLRRDVGATPVVGGNELRLDPAIASSDLGDFNSAIAAGDRWRALELYRGPFLDGFYLDAAPEFERWVEEERAGLARQAVECAEAVAREATAKGDLTAAAAAWRKAATLEPLSSRYATAYMTALANAGDRAGALAHARKHEEVVRRELDTAPDPEVVELAKRLKREKTVASAIPAEVSAERPVAGTEATTTAIATAPIAQPLRRTLRWAWISAVGGLVALLVILLLNRSESPAAIPLLAVGQVREGANRDTSTSAGVLTDMLATNLARVRGLQVVANSRLFELMRPGADSVRGAFSEAARRAGARQILEGEISYAREGGLQLDLRRIDLRSGVMRQGYRVRGLDRFALIDSATAAVARDFGFTAPGSTIAEVSTSSPIAYRFYEEGLRSYYQYDAAAAFRLMKSALTEDSTFAIAAFYAWLAGNVVSPNAGEPYLDLAIRLAPKAPDRERLLILGRARAYREDPSAVSPAESLAIRFPSDPNGQWLRGILASILGDYPVSIAALNRAVEIDSAAGFIGGDACRACESLNAMVQVYNTWDSAGAAERTARRWLRFEPRSTIARLQMAEAISRQRRWKEVDSLLRTVDSLEPGKRDYRELRMYELVRREDYVALEREALAAVQDASAELRTDAIWLWVIGLRNQGRLREAQGLLQGRLPDGTPFNLPRPAAIETPRATVEFESGRHDAASATYHQLVEENWKNPYPGHRARGVSWNLALETTAIAAKGDTAKVRELADSIEAVGRQSLFGRSPRLHYFVRGLLLASQERHAEAVAAYRRAIISWSDGFTRINYEMARNLMALGRAPEAIAALRPALRGAIDASNFYITRTELHEQLAQAFAAAGQPDSATAHYREVARAWEPADPPFQVRRRVALDWIQRHGR